MKAAEHPFLWGFAPADAEKLARGARERDFQRHEVIFRPGEPANSLYLLQEGRIALEAQGPKGGPVELQSLGGGEVLGWSWLFAPFVWSVQARAVEPTRALVLDGGRLLAMCEEDHRLGHAVMRRVAHLVVQRLEAASRRLADTPVPCCGFEEETTSASAWPDKPVTAALAEHPFSLGLKQAQLMRLTALATPARFAAEQEIARAGQPADRFYLIQRGRVGLYAEGSARLQLVHVICDGETMGWSWLYEPHRWHFHAQALEDTTALGLDGARLREECDVDSELGYVIMKRITHVVIRRLQATRKQLLGASSGHGTPGGA